MFKLSCPSCAGEIVFRSTDSVFAVCPYCKTNVVRHDVNLETYGSMADVQLDDTPFQIGTDGRYNNKHFMLAGRLRIKWSGGFWNEWYALFDDGTTGWLAEAQGFLAMNFERDAKREIPALGQLKPGREVTLEGKGIVYQVDDIKETVCVGSEGELPFRAPKGRRTTSVDLVGDHNSFGGIEYSEDDGARLFTGEYIDFDDFHFKNLRELDGW